jgi:hypothetical protein
MWTAPVANRGAFAISLGRGHASDNKGSEAAKPPEQSDAKHGPPSYKDMSLAALAGLVLFIFGVTQLSKGLEELNTDRMRNTLARFTSNPLQALPRVSSRPRCSSRRLSRSSW